MSLEKIYKLNNGITQRVVASENSIEQTLHKEVLKRSDESQAAYLHRAEKIVTKELEKTKGVLFDPTRSLEQDLPSEIIALISVVTEEALIPYGDNIKQQNPRMILEEINNEISYHSKFRNTEYSSANFDGTQRDRKFFEAQLGKGLTKRETYWNTLFFQYNIKSTRALAKKILDDKEIIILGGGRSKLKRELQKNNINPASIFNIDPFVEDVESSADTVIPLDACDQNLVEHLRSMRINKVDEIWAEFSVPAYLKDVKEIKQLIVNIDKLLKDGGTARIWPLMVSGGGNSEKLLARKRSLVESIKNIILSNNYEISLYQTAGRHGLILYKKISSSEEA